MPKRYLEEFKRDVVAYVRSPNLSQREVARDFGIWTHSIQRWVKQADVDNGTADGVTTDEHDLPQPPSTKLWSAPISAITRGLGRPQP